MPFMYLIKLAAPSGAYVFAGNVVILCIFGYMFGWLYAGYSILFQFISTKTISAFHHRYERVTLQITTAHAEEIMKAYMCKQRGIRLIKLPMKGTELDYANNLKKAFQNVHIFISSDTEEDVEIIKNTFERWRDSQ